MLPTAPPPAQAARKILPARRLVLLATVAGLGIATLFGGTGPLSTVPFTSTAAAQVSAEHAVRPTGFADIVERVKPAVIGVRVKGDAPTQREQMRFNNDELPFEQGSPLDEFLRRFGIPGMPGAPDGQRSPRSRGFSVAQGSGFFISPDGYAVTNNHVVKRGKTI